MTGDEKALTIAQGVGKKLAQRIILELRDKIGGAATELDFSGPVPAASPAGDSNLTLATAALQELGYSSARNCRCAEGLQRHRQHRGDGPLRLTCHGEPVMSLQKLTASQIPVCRFCQKLRLVPLPDSLTLFCPLEQGGSTS